MYFTFVVTLSTINIAARVHLDIIILNQAHMQTLRFHACPAGNEKLFLHGLKK